MSTKKIYLDFIAADSSGLMYLDPVQGENPLEVTMQSAGLDAAAVQSVLARLASRFDAADVEFVTQPLMEEIYSTIYVGITSAFDDVYPDYHTFAELPAAGANGFVDLSELPVNETVVAAQIEAVARVLTGETQASGGTIADYAAGEIFTVSGGNAELQNALASAAQSAAAAPVVVIGEGTYSDCDCGDICCVVSGGELNNVTGENLVLEEIAEQSSPFTEVPLWDSAPNQTTVYEATASDFDAKLLDAKQNEQSGNASILRLTGGDFVDRNVYADCIDFQIAGGSTGLKNYFHGGGEAIGNTTSEEEALVPSVFTGNVTVSSQGSVARGFIGGGKFLIDRSSTVSSLIPSYTGTSTNLTVAAGASGTVERLAGGAILTADPSQFSPKGEQYNARVRVAFDSSLTVEATDICVSKIAVGGSIIGGNANLLQTGNTSLVITGGTFDAVAGGSYLQHENAGTTLFGNSSVLISGGTFSNNIFGGHLSYNSRVNGMLDVQKGDISLTIDATNEICFGSNCSIVAGHSTSSTEGFWYSGLVGGNVTVTFRGEAQNLNGFCGVVWGDCGKSVAYSNGSWDDHVDGLSTLVFDDFVCTDQAKFNASRISCFDTYTVTGNSHAVLSGNINAQKVAMWNIEWNERDDAALVFDGIGSKADFSVDDGSITLTYGGSSELQVGQSWVAVQAKNENFFANFGSSDYFYVDLFGEAGYYKYDSRVKKECYSSENYTLELRKQKDYTEMVVTRLS